MNKKNVNFQAGKWGDMTRNGGFYDYMIQNIGILCHIYISFRISILNSKNRKLLLARILQLCWRGFVIRASQVLS